MKHYAGKIAWLSRRASVAFVAATSIAMLQTMSVSFAQDSADSKPAPVEEFSDTDIEFFENKVRPLLVANCLKCHGNDEEKLRGGLHLTSRAELLEGGDSGPAIVPGKPDESLLIASVRYEDFKMPPGGKLRNDEIEILVQWIEKGAPDPRTTERQTDSVEIDIEHGKEFWAFTARQNAVPPPVKHRDWPKTSIDHFILHRLESENILPVKDASRETLARRVHIALIGLPPTVEQIDNFVDHPNDLEVALAEMIDQLLQSPNFGERWGRHWLDVVRFAESSGGGRSLMFPDAWRFRDYVIDSFNADKPFDQFVKEQIAGDLLPYESHDQKIEQIVATGMLALGPTNYEQQDKEMLRMEVVDEQVDTIGRAFMGLTLGCARCHDHKFDPIPMTNYYAIAGIFGSTQSLVDANVSKYVESPLATESEIATEKRYRARVGKLSKQLKKAKEKLKQVDENSSSVADKKSRIKKSRSAGELPGIVIDDRDATLTGDWTESTSVAFFVDSRYLHDGDQNKGKNQAVFSPQLKTGGRYEVRLSYSPGGNRASNVPVTIDHQDGQETVIVNQSQRPPIDGLFISLGTYRFEADNRSVVTVSTTDTDGHVIVDAVQFLSADDLKDESANKKQDNGNQKKANQNAGSALADSDQPESKKPEPSKQIQELQFEVKRLDQQLTQLKREAPRPVDVAMSVKDAPKPTDGHLHIRGSVRNLGPVIERGFISVCCEGDSKPVLGELESGRLQLARWIAEPEHPLTARVYVNRVWRHLFGQGLVATTDNFGLMGRRPSHPELLDHLANEFVENGWSTKKLIREIMLSHVYRLSSGENPAARAMDEENRLLWRANRRRVDAEVLRDSMLFLAGNLDPTRGGLTIRKISQYDLNYEFDTVRRSVYVPAFRNSMLDVFEVFDFANPNLVIGHRNTSTLPTQSLFLMNNPMVMQQSRKFADRILAHEELNESQRLELAYRQSLGRRPTEMELAAALKYIRLFTTDPASADSQQAWASFCHSLFASLDFRYVE